MTTETPTSNMRMPVLANHLDKPEKFDGRFLTENPPTPKIDEPNVASSSDANVHPKVDVEKNMAKELWQSLERKYKTEDAGAKKIMVGRFLDYKMNDFKNYLKHKRKEMNVEELVIRLRIEEENKSASKNSFVKNQNLNPKGGISKKFTGKCFNCNGMGHRSSDCKKPRRVLEANLTQELSDMDLCAIISEVNLVGSNP
ncbi:uncharacterized protein LOC124928895 [Impatiens glandulifera]|uniref:uncharacterized protein LOC124928895 n=1 Tax=Impatiens glandulifera TaxID=253017 RepID=UPI001FB0F7A0|nr:uncharacterized protein LOC124928895 [Impatiens glandulifera]